jgi:glycosyltransferase involved in cell wall biosynthesis
MNETGCDSIVSNKQFTKSKIESNELSLLWVGKLDFRKQLSIAIRTIAELKEKKISLHVLGSGDSDVYKELASKLGISAKIIWHGLVAHSEVQRLMYESDALFFTSVAEGTPHSVLEAISNGLPVICFDTCGQGDVVDSSVGIKIPLTTPSGSVKTFAEKIEYLYNNRDELVRMSENCIMCAEKNYWDKKAQHVVSLYDNLLAKSHE